MPDQRRRVDGNAQGIKSRISAMRIHLFQVSGTPSTRGFTLVEMMTTLTVLAVIMVIAVPSLSGLVRSSKVRSAQSDLVASLMLARSEAAKRGVMVGLAASAPTVGNEFAKGWTVWVDANEDGVIDSTELVIRSYPSLGSAVVLGTTGNVTKLAFNASGFLVPATAVAFKACGASDTTAGFAVRLEPVGLADIQETACP